jgi:predicted transposase/invertase (TIGR01784 family)
MKPKTEKDIFVPELLPPSEDGIFKTLLTHEDAKPVLRDVIASILNIPVAEATVRNGELPISDIGEKRERFDVNCKTADGKQIDVEMQAEPMRGDSVETGCANLKNRAVYYLCDLHASQEGRGTDYGELMRSFQITLCDFTVFPKKKEFVSRFFFRDEAGEALSEAAGIVFVELSKLKTAMRKPVSEMTPAEMWAIFFGHADEPKHAKLLREIRKTKEEIEMAHKILTNISKDEKERAHYRSRKMFRTDMEHSMAVSRKEGMAKGIEKGIEKGMEKGKVEVAKNALALRLPVEQIEALTGFSREEIEGLRAAGPESAG